MSAAPNVKDGLKFEIEVTKGPHIGLRLSFTKGSATIGRGPENDIVLSSDPRVSRQHAEIKQRGSDFLVVNLSGKNFILLDGESVQSEVLRKDSVIQIGDTEIRFIADLPEVVSTPVAPAPSPLTPAARPSSPFTPVTPAPVFTPKPQMPSTPQAQGVHIPAFQQSMPPSMPQAGGLPGMPHNNGGMNYGGYQAPHAGPAMGGAVGSGGGLLQNPKVRFYGIIAIVGLVGWFFLSGSKNKNAKDPNAIRTSAISLQDVAEAEKRTQELATLKKDKYDSVQYRRAQENFVRGFRDFQQGQYARAREAFQVVLNLDPDNELAKRYFHLSKIKFDELVKFNMIQGNRYREKRNWRMCQSNYSNVMTMLQNRKDDPSFKEAKQYYEECSLNVEAGRF